MGGTPQGPEEVTGHVEIAKWLLVVYGVGLVFITVAFFIEMDRHRRTRGYWANTDAEGRAVRRQVREATTLLNSWGWAPVDYDNGYDLADCLRIMQERVEEQERLRADDLARHEAIQANKLALYETNLHTMQAASEIQRDAYAELTAISGEMAVHMTKAIRHYPKNGIGPTLIHQTRELVRRWEAVIRRPPGS